VAAWGWRSWTGGGTAAAAGEVVLVAALVLPTYLLVLRLVGRPEPAQLTALVRAVGARLRRR
ncbi:MAG: hypothetical protein M3513_00835, partial [Actinomycetota bacterium]|nr:hypothetical protein [Actinomycetota bacterium]